MEILQLQQAMIKYMSGDARRIQHFLKVHAFAKMIGELEKIPADLQYTLETAALTHDIGIKNGEAKHGQGLCTGKHQEEEGPAVAEKLLTELGCDVKTKERVCYLVGHHHTFNNIQGLDYQILIEADYLVNLYEDGLPKENICTAIEKIFKTTAGIRLCKAIYGIED